MKGFKLNRQHLNRFLFLIIGLLISQFSYSQTIQKLEYFIDGDPGYGNGVDVQIQEAATLDDFSFTIDVEGLSEGTHFIHTRVQDSNGEWSEVGRRSFYRYAISVDSLSDLSSLVAVEYFIDTDPGFGQASSVSLDTSDSINDVEFDIDISALEAGIHTIFFRVQNESGDWSETTKRTFFRFNISNDTLQAAAEIIAMEYFINTDPGYGNGNAITIESGISIENLEFDVDLNGLTEGSENTLFVRAKDTNNQWSEVAVETFIVCTDLPNVVLAEAGQIDVCPGENPDVDLTLEGVVDGETIQWFKDNEPISGATTTTYNATQFGVYSASIQNEGGCEVLTEDAEIVEKNIGTITLNPETTEPLCFGSTNEVSIIYEGDLQNLEFTWLKDGVEIDHTGDSLIVENAGTYQVTTTVEGCEFSSEPIDVIIGEDFTIEISENFSTCTSAADFTLEASPAGGEWTGNVENASGLFSPSTLGSGSYNATYTYTDNAGCTESQSLTITVSDQVEVLIDAFPPIEYLDSLQLSAAPQNGVWSGEDITEEGYFTPQRTGQYTLSYSFDPDGCGGTDEVIFEVEKADQTIAFEAFSEKIFGDDPLISEANTDSGLDLIYSSSNENVATISEDTIFIIGAGSSLITVRQPGNDNYNAATDVSQELIVSKADQEISFERLVDKTFGDDPFTMEGSTNSGLELSYTSSNTEVATISGDTIVIVGGGTSLITASQAGNDNYNAAADVSQELVVQKAEQEISIEQVEDKFVTSDDFEIIASTTSGLALSYQILSGPATITGNLVSLTGDTGTIEVEVSQAGNEDYNRASATTSITVLSDPCLDFAVNASVTDEISCQGANDGAIFLNVENGTSPFTYFLNGSELGSNFAENLAAGQYEISVMDANDCNALTSIVLDEPQALQITSEVTDNTSINGNGSIALSITGGTGNYSFEWDNGESTPQIEGLLMGSYTVTVSDGNGCSLTETFEVGGVTGKNDKLEGDVIIYPNPSNHDVQIIHSEEIESLILYDVYGRVLFESQPNSNETVVDISKLSSGSYFMRLNKGKIHRIVKE